MKKFFCFIAMIALLTSLFSCGGDMQENTQSLQNETDATSITSASVTSAMTETIASAHVTSEIPEITTSAQMTSDVPEITEATTEETLPPVEKKPIRAILHYGYKSYLSSFGLNAYRFSYYTRTETVTGETPKTPIDQNDPLGTNGIVNQKTVTADTAAFDALCDELYELRFDLLPESVEPDPLHHVMDGWHLYIVIYFEDGSVFVSQGYAADSYNDRYKQVYDCLTAYSSVN